ncbi:MAG: low temperature requirement protein A [Solirubrobacteraceae bacterium]
MHQIADHAPQEQSEQLAPEFDPAHVPDAEKRVTSLELFFDLVFVFALTQVTGFVSADPSWTRLLEGLAILAALWFAWSGYAWLGNTADAEEEIVRLPLLGAMGAMLIASLAVPHAFGSDGLVFGLAYCAVRAFHVGIYALVARREHDRRLQQVVWRLATTTMPAAGLLLLAGALPAGTLRALLWIAALLVDYGGILVRGIDGWRITASHFAERHSLVVIIALGETIVSLGVGADRVPLEAGVILAALLGLAVAAALWWAYFDVVALVAERRLRSAREDAQALMARDSYTYLHLPMIAGIVVFAIGVKRTIPQMSTHLAAVPATALCSGVAAYLLALSVFKRRNVGSFNRPRLLVGGSLVALTPLMTLVPALLALGIVTALLCGMLLYEVHRYTEARDRIRHPERAA